MKTQNTTTIAKATFAGGCFWCIESAFATSFKGKEGVLEVVSGYTGGTKENPSYYEVASGTTGHLEAVEVTYDPNKVKYEELLDIFWKNIDPTDDKGQFADKGSQYTTAIFYHDVAQKNLAQKSKKELEASGKFAKPIVTRIIPASYFYRAEDYHQGYYKKNPLHYKAYKKGSGREAYIEKMWEEKK